MSSINCLASFLFLILVVKNATSQETRLQWSNWGSWSECSATCGRGVQTRRRICHDVSGCSGDSMEEKPCMSPHTCPCTCDSNRSCTDRIPGICVFANPDQCEENRFVQRNCRKSCRFCTTCICGTWSVWETTECSRSCGPGLQFRRRTCPQGYTCNGVQQITLTCTKGDCTIWATWSLWNNWGGCSVTCGAGTQQRIRLCPGSCQGSSIQVRECQVTNCPVFNDQWSPCSRSCDWGTRTRQICPFCQIKYEDCKIRDCPSERCVAPFYPRFRTRIHSCCDATNSRATSCGVNSIAPGRIVGGNIATRRAWPWMVQLHIGTNLVCGGSLVSNNIVITAAHCFREKNYESVTLLFGALMYEDSSVHVQTRVVGRESVYIHSGINLMNDIAIVKLSQSVTIGGLYVRPICLPQGEDLPQDLQCVASGWGKTRSTANSGSVILRDVVLRILPFEVCTRAFPYDITSSELMICAGKLSGEVDTCTGDSGGPLMCQRCSSCSWFLAGITSFGSSSCGSSENPGVYTRISGFERWIDSIVGYNISSGSYSSCL